MAVVISATSRRRYYLVDSRGVLQRFPRGWETGAMASALVEGIGGLAAVLTTLCLVPQALKIAREREARAISLSSTMFSILGVFLWLIYGVAVADAPLICSSAISFAITATILALKIRHG